MSAAAPLRSGQQASPGSAPWQLTAGELSTAYFTGQLDPETALDAIASRFDIVQGTLNPIATYDLDGARRAAAESARRWRTGRPCSALDGVVMTIKDNIPVAGLPCRWGSRLYASHVPAQDELAVARLRAAGVVILGKTNVPEFTLQGYTDNLLQGATGNPWNPSLTPGGSSGGAVASVAAGLGPIALGTDGGGSIRRPAGFTGLCGLKPSWGRVARRHALPDILPELEVVGPIARSIGDLAKVMGIIADGPNWEWDAVEQRPPRLRICVWRDIDGSPVEPAILHSLDAACAAFASMGHHLTTRPAPREVGRFNRESWPVLSSTGLAALIGDDPARRDLLGPALQALLQQGLKRSAVEHFSARRQVTELRATLAALFADFDLILTPSSAAQPWPKTLPHPETIAGKDVDGRGHAVFTAFANAAGLPALAVPAEPDAQGMPIGLQLVGPAGCDARLLALGHEYEKHCPWRHRRPELH